MVLNFYEGLWASLAAPLIRRMDAQSAHHTLLEVARVLDGIDPAILAAQFANRETLPEQPTSVGGVTLPHPLILSAGFVKGDGFALEQDALAAVAQGRNIIPGWRTMPALVGAVEFGSFTRYPRLGNPGRVMWRDNATASTQNRVGLRNPGARAAASFLSLNGEHLPPVFGINLAVSPGVTDPSQEVDEVLDSAHFFLDAGVIPSWLTLNLSCPNTEDDPGANQTAAKARRLCAALVNAVDVPVWIKVSPDLSPDQYAALMTVFAETGIRAVIATNTLAQPTPDGTAVAGVGGGRLRDSALEAVRHLKGEEILTPSDLRSASPLPHAVEGEQKPMLPVSAGRSDKKRLDLIGCGGIIHGGHLRDFRDAGASAFMIYSALVFRGPLAAALILHESR